MIKVDKRNGLQLLSKLLVFQFYFHCISFLLLHHHHHPNWENKQMFITFSCSSIYGLWYPWLTHSIRLCLGFLWLSYLSASTFSIILASQLGFTAFFSFFLNSQKFTPFIINSIVLLTISSTLLACQPSSSSLSGVSKANHAIGFICTLGTAASAALGLSLSQFFFRRVIKKESFRAVVDMIIFELLVASCMILAGVFASGEWKDLSKEMEGFGLGKVSYVMTLVWTAIAWQVFQIGFVGLIFEVSSLFCNVISSLSLPIIQVMAAIVFHDHMNGLKVISMVLAIWGSVSYIYQNYLDDQESKSTTEDSYSNANSGVSKEASSI
nr:purine permease 21-like [Ziziphus jujuba var. spinosa]